MTEESLKKIRKLAEELKGEIGKVIRASVSHVIEVMFHNQIIVSDAPNNKDESHIIYALVESEQEYMRSILRFGFEQNLLKMLVQKIYGADVIIDRKILEDAACEISNIVSKRVKALMNFYSMAIDMSIPYVERKFDREFLSAGNLLQIHFLLYESRMGVDFMYKIKAI